MAARGPARLQCMVSICSTQGHSCVVSLKFITRFPVMIPREGVCGDRGSTMNYSQAEMSSHGWERKFHNPPDANNAGRLRPLLRQ